MFATLILFNEDPAVRAFRGTFGERPIFIVIFLSFLAWFPLMPRCNAFEAHFFWALRTLDFRGCCCALNNHIDTLRIGAELFVKRFSDLLIIFELHVFLESLLVHIFLNEILGNLIFAPTHWTIHNVSLARFLNLESEKLFHSRLTKLMTALRYLNKFWFGVIFIANLAEFELLLNLFFNKRLVDILLKNKLILIFHNIYY